MQLSQVLVALLASAVSASPMAKRACSVVDGTPASFSVSKGASQTVYFNPPAGAVGACQVEANLPAGFPITVNGYPSINMIDVNGPAPGAIVGTGSFPSTVTQPTRVIFNSFACRPNMQYRFEIADWSSGSVSWPTAAPHTGLIMTYGC